MRNPFIPSRSRICRLADMVLIFAVSAAGLSAAVVSLLLQVTR
jgi:hypothetical protein